jgi:hypothetical protein
LADYFDACRCKRNEIDYTGATIASATEADEMVFHPKSFLKMVEEWSETTHPMVKGYQTRPLIISPVEAAV